MRTDQDQQPVQAGTCWVLRSSFIFHFFLATARFPSRCLECNNNSTKIILILYLSCLPLLNIAYLDCKEPCMLRNTLLIVHTRATRRGWTMTTGLVKQVRLVPFIRSADRADLQFGLKTMSATLRWSTSRCYRPPYLTRWIRIRLEDEDKASCKPLEHIWVE